MLFMKFVKFVNLIVQRNIIIRDEYICVYIYIKSCSRKVYEVYEARIKYLLLKVNREKEILPSICCSCKLVTLLSIWRKKKK